MMIEASSPYKYPEEQTGNLYFDITPPHDRSIWNEFQISEEEVQDKVKCAKQSEYRAIYIW